MTKLRVLDLFSGIGGFSLGLERTGGFETVAFCEIEDFPRRVLAKHWPNVPCYHDVRELTGERLAADGIAVDVICGGFPCQDISSAGHRAGIDGDRSGLWTEYARLIRELRPRFVIVENVADLLSRGLGRVLGDLVALRLDAEWHCIPASAVGAPHRRDRLWLVAHAQRREGQFRYDPAMLWGRAFKTEQARVGGGALAHPESDGLEEQRIPAEGRKLVAQPAGSGWRREDAGSPSRQWWATEPNVGRVAHGVPARVDRLKALGNAVVPQIPELIGNAILASIREAA
jgi:DNA (cytosine-5)-methyltransferase 1